MIHRYIYNKYSEEAQNVIVRVRVLVRVSRGSLV